MLLTVDARDVVSPVCRKLEEGKLVSKRFLTKTNRAPRWMEKVCV